MQHLWNRHIELQELVATLKVEKQELADWQTEAMGKLLDLRSHLAKLKREESRLHQKLEETQAPPPPAATLPASGTASDTTKFFKDMAD